MKKEIITAGLICLLTFSACTKNTTDDIYDLGSDQETSSELIEDTSSEDSQNQTEDSNEGTQGSATVTEDVYDGNNEAVDETEINLVGQVTSIDDPVFKEKVQKFIEFFYYNIFFSSADHSNGITEEEMIKFVISYIYQHEYNELKFDTSTFELYVPEERVEELVTKFFDARVSGHHSFEAEAIPYVDGYYLMPAVDTGWAETLAIEKIEVEGDFSYLVSLGVTDPNTSDLMKYQVALEVRQDRLIMKSFILTSPTTTDGE